MVIQWQQSIKFQRGWQANNCAEFGYIRFSRLKPAPSMFAFYLLYLLLSIFHNDFHWPFLTTFC